jgi:hypothetical protein
MAAFPRLKPAVTVDPAPRHPEDQRDPRFIFAVACFLLLVPVLRVDIWTPEFITFFCWLGAMACYLLVWPRPRGLLTWRPSPWLLATLAVYALALFAAFCAVYADWRWAVTGDSLTFYQKGPDLIARRVHPLNVRGAHEQCTVIQATLQNAFMHISPTLFAHRLGNLLTSALIVIAAALFAAETSSAVAAVLLALFLPVHSVFATFTMISYPNLSALLPYYAAYALFAAALRRPSSDYLWAALGLTCGLAVYFMPLWMGAIAVVSSGVVVSALHWRTPRPLLIWAVGALVALVPALLQLNALLNLYLIFRAGLGLTWDYFLKIAAQSLSLPFHSEQHAYGAEGAWMRPPFDYLFLLGVGLAAVSGILALLGRARPRSLQHAWVWLLMYAGDAIGLALQNSGYGAVSIKRAIVLLPAMTFLTVLPLAWLTERVSRSWFTVVLSAAAIASFAYLNLTMLWSIDFGYNVADGMVRMIQVAPGRVLLVTRDQGLLRTFGPEPLFGSDPLQELYQVRDHTIVSNEIPGHRGDFERVVCVSGHTDGADWSAQVRDALATLCPNKPLAPITPQLECVTCDPG